MQAVGCVGMERGYGGGGAWDPGFCGCGGGGGGA